MRILLLSQFYPPVIGGEERHVRSLGAGLAARGHHVRVVTQASEGHAEVESELGMDIHRISGTFQRATRLFSDAERRHMPPFPDPEFGLGLRRSIARFKPQIVHAHNWVVHSFTPLKCYANAPLVLTLHDYGFRCAKKNLMHKGVPCSGPALGKCLRCASDHYGVAVGSVTTVANWAMTALSPVDKYLAVSGAVAALNNLRAQAKPFEVVPNFIPDDVAEPKDEHDERMAQLPSEPYLLFVGDLNQQKGLHVVIAAYEQLKSRPPLVLIGRPFPDTPERLPDGARILTNWPHPSVMRAWHRSLLALVPSISPEPCATVVLEAMACGKPVIATDIGGNPEMVDHEQTGLLVPANNATALAGAMQSLLENPAMRESMGAAALQKVRDFQASSVIPRIEGIYRDLIQACAQVGAGKEQAATAPHEKDKEP